MTEKELNELKLLIDDQIQLIETEIIELTELTKPISLDASIGRVSRMDAINNKAINDLALRDNKSTLQKLERAKERGENSELGICLKCGEEIPFGRLKIMPYTTRCVRCA